MKLVFYPHSTFDSTGFTEDNNDMLVDVVAIAIMLFVIGVAIYGIKKTCCTNGDGYRRLEPTVAFSEETGIVFYDNNDDDEEVDELHFEN